MAEKFKLKDEYIEFRHIKLMHHHDDVLFRVVKAVLPETIEPLKGKAATEFINYDTRELTLAEKKSLKKADTVYAKHKVTP